jgi:hypothetical protein
MVGDIRFSRLRSRAWANADDPLFLQHFDDRHRLCRHYGRRRGQRLDAVRRDHRERYCAVQTWGWSLQPPRDGRQRDVTACLHCFAGPGLLWVYQRKRDPRRVNALWHDLCGRRQRLRLNLQRFDVRRQRDGPRLLHQRRGHLSPRKLDRRRINTLRNVSARGRQRRRDRVQRPCLRRRHIDPLLVRQRHRRRRGGVGQA